VAANAAGCVILAPKLVAADGLATPCLIAHLSLSAVMLTQRFGSASILLAAFELRALIAAIRIVPSYEKTYYVLYT